MSPLNHAGHVYCDSAQRKDLAQFFLPFEEPPVRCCDQIPEKELHSFLKSPDEDRDDSLGKASCHLAPHLLQSNANSPPQAPNVWKPSKRVRSPSMKVKLAAPVASQLCAKPVATVSSSKSELSIPHLYKRSKAHNGRGTERDYLCAHCGRRKTSSSACSDGRVRIRCECGGHRQDGQPRMHVSWDLVRSNEARETSTPITRPVVVQAPQAPEAPVATNDTPWVFVDDTYMVCA